MDLRLHTSDYRPGAVEYLRCAFTRLPTVGIESVLQLSLPIHPACHVWVHHVPKVGGNRS